jgi:hypothetical protein
MNRRFLKSAARWILAACFVCSWTAPTSVFAQQPALEGPNAPGNGQGTSQSGSQPGGVQAALPQGGAAQADFDSLIDLIQSTVSADTWMENGTGDGEISPFDINGVYVDAAGTLSFAKSAATESTLSNLVKPAPTKSAGDPRVASSLRYVSLPRLERAIARRQAAGAPLDAAMLTLAGLQRVEYVIVAPESHDLILAGPAGDWRIEPDGAILSTDTGQSVVRLDDLLTLGRRKQTHDAKSFGCSIIPRQAALAATQQFVAQSNARPLEPGQRGAWLKQLRDTLGKQDAEFFGIDGQSHVARVLLLADYHMKLIGMGIADGVDGVQSYLSTVRLQADGAPPPMAVLRWWFSLNYEPTLVREDRNVYQLQGQGVKVLSENEMLAARGQRVHTGQSDDLNAQFAASFTEHFAELSAMYPLYSELRNVFDLSVVLSLMEAEGLLERIKWQPAQFADSGLLPLPHWRVPTEVETVINHRVLRRRHIVAGISGGVWVDSESSLQLRTATAASMADLPMAPPVPVDGGEAWWWD